MPAGQLGLDGWVAGNGAAGLDPGAAAPRRSLRQRVPPVLAAGPVSARRPLRRACRPRRARRAGGGVGAARRRCRVLGGAAVRQVGPARRPRVALGYPGAGGRRRAWTDLEQGRRQRRPTQRQPDTEPHGTVGESSDGRPYLTGLAGQLAPCTLDVATLPALRSCSLPSGERLPALAYRLSAPPGREVFLSRPNSVTVDEPSHGGTEMRP